MSPVSQRLVRWCHQSPPKNSTNRTIPHTGLMNPTIKHTRTPIRTAIGIQRLRQSSRFVAATYTQDCCVICRAPEGCGIGAVTALAPGLIGAGLYMVCGGLYCGIGAIGVTVRGVVCAIAALAHRIAGIISSFRTMLSVARWGQSAPVRALYDKGLEVVS